MNMKPKGMIPLCKSKKGQMPFALIAITLLLLGSMYGVITANINDSEDTTQTITTELMSISEAIDDTKKYIESGIGDIINEISTSDSGTLTERVSAFDSRLGSWLSSKFPLKDDGVSVSLEKYNIKLGVENLKLSSGDFLSDSSKPSFFRATGTADVKYTTSTGSSIKTLEISADGTSGLPFIIDAATRFELSSSGGASVLTELMTYQLSSIAQKRILDGYGAISESGGKGTRDILTENDVRESFRSSLSIIESLCFRNTGDDASQLNEHDKLDAAELLIGKDGYYNINTSAIVSQAMVAVADQLIAKWLDLFFAKDILNIVDNVDDYLQIGCNWIMAQLTGKDGNSARPYIESMMKNAGYSKAEYRFVGNNGKMTFHIEGGTFDCSKWYEFNNGKYEVESFDVTIDCAAVDILSWGGWDNFMSDYLLDRNDIIEFIKNTVNTVAIRSANDAKSVRVYADAFDDESFIDSLSSAVSDAFNEGINVIETETNNMIDTGTIADPKYIGIFEKMENNKKDIFNIDSVLNGIEDSLKNSISEHLRSLNISTLDDSLIEALYQKAIKSNEFRKLKESYEDDVENKLDIYENVLMNVPKNNDSIIKNVLTMTFNQALKCDEIHNSMCHIADAMIIDMKDYQGYNIKSDVIDLCNSNSFTLYNAKEQKYEEFVDISDDYILNVTITSPKDNTSKNSHVTDIDVFTLSPFTSVFTVSMRTDVHYDIKSTSSILDALDWYDGKMSGTFNIDTKFDVPCVSGWALAGVKYPDTANIIDEIIEQLMKICEPLIESLKEIFELLKQLFEICSTAVVEITNYINDMIMKFYEAVLEPLQDLQQFIENGVMEAIDSFAFDIGIATQEISFVVFGMTLSLEFRAASLTKTVKNICKMTLSSSIGDVDFSVGTEIKYSEKNGLMFKGTGEVSSDDWKIKLMIDPAMKFGSKFITASGQIRGVGFSASMPEVEQYDVVDLSVSDVPGVSEVLSNIPLPIPGYKGSFDMGFELKYNHHIPTGLLINEFESNPKGTDTNEEWAELYNASASTIDLDGYMLIPGTDESKYVLLSGTISPFEKKVVKFDKQALNNSKNKKGNGEMLTLLNESGEIVDSTPWKTDSYNDDRTWQRTSDGGVKWDLLPGSPGKSNGTPFGGSIVKEFVIDNLKTAGEKAFYQMGNHLTSVDDVAKFLQLIVKLFIEELIESIADILVCAAVYISFELTDYAQTQHVGLRLSLEMDSELVKEGLEWLLSQIGFLASYIDSPKCSDPFEIVCNDTYFRTMVYAGISAPKFLSDKCPQVQMGISSKVNISGLMSVFGNDEGRWKAEFGVVIEDCPFDLVPKKMNENKGSKCDLWLMKMSFCEA